MSRFQKCMHNKRCCVELTNRQREIPFSFPSNVAEQLVITVLENESQQANLVSIHFVSDRVMRRHHKKFFDDSSSTDCMSFPIDRSPDEAGYRHLGDIFVCPLVASTRANGDPAKFFYEISLYIVHGLLHLLGYNDETPKEKTVMRRRERSAMARFYRIYSAEFNL